MTVGVTMKAHAVDGQRFRLDAESLTERRQPRPADAAERVLHSSSDFGATFQFALSGAAMRAWISGLTVFGTGTVRAGTFPWCCRRLRPSRGQAGKDDDGPE